MSTAAVFTSPIAFSVTDPGPGLGSSVHLPEVPPVHGQGDAQQRQSGRCPGLVVELYFGYARAGRAALWVHVSDDDDAKRAVRALADHQVLHCRHYGHDSQQDLHIG